MSRYFAECFYSGYWSAFFYLHIINSWYYNYDSWYALNNTFTYFISGHCQYPSKVWVNCNMHLIEAEWALENAYSMKISQNIPCLCAGVCAIPIYLSYLLCVCKYPVITGMNAKDIVCGKRDNCAFKYFIHWILLLWNRDTHTVGQDRYHFSMYLLTGAHTLVPIIMYMYYMY